MATLSWDDLQFFLAVVRERQLSRAARVLGTSHVTVSRRIDRLERSLDTRLFERNPRGYEPTPASLRLIETAERMEEAELQLQLHRGSPVHELAADLRCIFTRRGITWTPARRSAPQPTWAGTASSAISRR